MHDGQVPPLVGVSDDDSLNDGLTDWQGRREGGDSFKVLNE